MPIRSVASGLLLLAILLGIGCAKTPPTIELQRVETLQLSEEVDPYRVARFSVVNPNLTSVSYYGEPSFPFFSVRNGVGGEWRPLVGLCATGAGYQKLGGGESFELAVRIDEGAETFSVGFEVYSWPWSDAQMASSEPLKIYPDSEPES
ncbi:MAG: hypothetical protein AAF517_22500 [Planctomycetota bacterium]